MILLMNPAIATGYSSHSQIARVVTESWGASHLYCAACPSEALHRMRNNSPATDYVCANCGARYQLKSSTRWSDKRVVDAGYHAMMQAIRSGEAPNLILLQYDRNWAVVNLLLVPDLFFVPPIIERRRPLSGTARRAGWIGCNILLDAIPPEGKIRIVDKGVVTPPTIVRQKYEVIKPLAKVDVEARGWTLDVLNIARSLGTGDFSLGDVYEHEVYFQGLHPKNRFVRPKIRQQLQVLRDMGYLEFLGRGRYRFLH